MKYLEKGIQKTIQSVLIDIKSFKGKKLEILFTVYSNETLPKSFIMSPARLKREQSPFFTPQTNFGYFLRPRGETPKILSKFASKSQK